MFKPGDRVVHKYGILKGAAGTILADLLNDTYEIKFDYHPKVLFVATGSELEHEPPTLPVGKQQPLDFPKESFQELKCDCGGYKVFGTMNEIAHSPWCSALKAV